MHQSDAGPCPYLIDTDIDIDSLKLVSSHYVKYTLLFSAFYFLHKCISLIWCKTLTLVLAREQKYMKYIRIKPFGHSRAKKNKKNAKFDHFPRPGEIDPYGLLQDIPDICPF